MLDALVQTAAKSAPAGGAETSEALIATAGAAVITAIMLAIVIGHRTGRLKAVGRVAAFAERSSGIPGWSSLPLAFVAGALFVAVLGMYWDISIHIDEGRDPGPLANAAHYLILLGLFGIFFAGLLSICLPMSGRPSSAAVKLTGDWYAPLGGVLMTASSSFALAAFPMDDVWHRIFGQDVTLWGPTHLVLIGGAGLATVGALILLAEGARSRGRGTPRNLPRALPFRQVAVAGAFLTALSTFQAEFDFSVPQFRQVWHPILLMLAAGIGLVSARMTIGRGGALAAVGVFIAIRAALTVWVGPLTGHTALHFPLYIVEALVVEAIALRANLLDRPIRFGALAGLGIGTLGLAGEWLWTNIWFTQPWTSALVPEGIIAGVLAGVAGGVIGAFVGGCLRTPPAERLPETRWAPAVAAVVAIGLFAWALPMNAGDPPVKAQVAMEEATPPPKRSVNLTVKLDPADAAEDAEWLNSTAWQGGGSNKSIVEDLEQVGPGEYRTAKPIPVYGNWKSTLRLHKDRQVAGLAVFMPADPAVPVKGIPAQSGPREFVLDKENLLREQKKGVSPVVSTIAYLIVLLIAIGLTASLAWGLARFAQSERTAA